MTNYSKVALQTAISTFVGIAVSLFLVFFAYDHPATFWVLLILIWGIISLVLGLFAESYIDGVFIGLFQSIYTSFITFLALLLIRNFSEILIQVLNFLENAVINNATVLIQSLILTIIFFLIFITITICLAVFGFFIKTRFVGITNPPSPDEIEEKYYKKYVTPKDKGRYKKQIFDDDNT
ncbi:MAG: hypothetical protein FK734_13395 [Asgard group archaeon]|nr:hypothetical protein [Asgard group archaeon]